MKIGFIGLGIMGSRMAHNLQKAGHALIVHNRTPSKADELIAGGAVWADSPASVAQHAPQVLITMLGDPAAVRAVALGEGGFLQALPAGTIWMDCSTVNPSFSREMAQIAAQHSLRFLDAPVAGSKAPATSGDLLFLVGGETEAVETCQPLFDVMGRRTVHMGAAGSGTGLKVVVNYLLAAGMATFAEALALGAAQGIAPESLMPILVPGPVTAPFLEGKKGKIESGDFEAEFPLQWMHKDLQMAAITAYEQGVPMPLANAAKELYQQAVRAGLGELDFSAITRIILGDA